jgi:hypothetical protein
MSHRSARCSVVFGGVVFMTAQVLLNAAVRSNVIPLADPIYIEKFERLQQHQSFFTPTSDRTRYLLLGSSRSQLGFDAMQYSSRLSARVTHPVLAFNFGTHGAGPITNLLYLHRLTHAGVSAEHIMVEIHPCLLDERALEVKWLSSYRLRVGEAEVLRSPTPSHRDDVRRGG